MPSVIVKITWDFPDDPNWLNKYNIELVLAEYCPNTAFEVVDWPPPALDVDEFYDDEESWKPPNNSKLFDLLEGP